ncbi:MAG: hypothetical protein R3C16_05625 [Hyphomonadaceae bacterium]
MRADGRRAHAEGDGRVFDDSNESAGTPHLLSHAARDSSPSRERKRLDLSFFSSPTDPRVYDMLQQADSIGVFQVESRAQMSMLPRLKPSSHDLVIEVAIVRPGPIQGGMVHPYLKRRRAGEGKLSVERAGSGAGTHHGVPLFQEQAMQIAVVGAGLRPRRPISSAARMATFKRRHYWPSSRRSLSMA